LGLVEILAQNIKRLGRGDANREEVDAESDDERGRFEQRRRCEHMRHSGHLYADVSGLSMPNPRDLKTGPYSFFGANDPTWIRRDERVIRQKHLFLILLGRLMEWSTRIEEAPGDRDDLISLRRHFFSIRVS
jgi:hypothetical protein